MGDDHLCAFFERATSDVEPHQCVPRQRAGGVTDASISVVCGSTPQVLDKDMAENIALFKTGHDRHRHTFLGVYRLTTRRSEGKPVYQVGFTARLPTLHHT